MKILNSKHVQASGIYFIGNILNAAVPFLLMPILTRHLTPSDYGIMSMFGVLQGIVGNFIGLSIHGAISRRYYDKSNENFSLYVGATVTLLFITLPLVAIASFIFKTQISLWTEVPESWVIAASFCAFFQFVALTIQTIWRLEVKPIPFVSLSLFSSLTNVATTILLVVFIGMKWEGRILAQVFTGFIVAAISLLLLWARGYLKFNVGKNRFRNILKFGLPLIPHSFTGQAFAFIDRFLLTNFIGIAMTGTYAVAAQIGLVLSLIIDSFHKSYIPWLYSQLSQDSPQLNKRVVRFTFMAIGVYIVSIAVFALIMTLSLDYLVGKEFRAAKMFIPWICLGQLFHAFYYLLVPYIPYSEKTHYLSYITVTSVFINLGFSYYLILSLGPIGAPIGAGVGYLFSFIACWFVAAKVHPMPWLFKK